MLKKNVTKLLLAGMTVLAVAVAQPSNQSLMVENAVPFGTVSGQLLLLDDSLVFVDTQQPESSFVVPRSAIDSLTADGQSITVGISRDVRNRSGNVRRLNFRIAQGDSAGATRWFNARSSAPRSATETLNSNAIPGNAAAQSNLPASANQPPPASPDQGIYEARHDHFAGSCTGRLIVSPVQLSYESVDNVSHSRRWEYASIKEIKQPNPYEIEIKPFKGDDYKLKLGGSGMDPAAFKAIVDHVTAARSNGNGR